MLTQEPYSRARLFATYAGPIKKIKNTYNVYKQWLKYNFKDGGTVQTAGPQHFSVGPH